MDKISVCKMQGPGFNAHLGTKRLLSEGKLCDSHEGCVIPTKVGRAPGNLGDSLMSSASLPQAQTSLPTSCPQVGLFLRKLGDFQASY